MPYICMVRQDIPSGTLQVLDLQPNTSQRSLIYDPPGQTKYVSFRPQNDNVVLSGAGPITTVEAYNGLAAYLVDHIENQNAGEALTAAEANAIAADIIANLLDNAAAATSAAINTRIQVTVAASGIGIGDSTATVVDILRILSGDQYTVPAGSTVEDGANDFVATQAGSFINTSGGTGTSRVRHTYDTGALVLSYTTGELSKFVSATFTYLGTAGRALVVYDDDGTVLA